MTETTLDLGNTNLGAMRRLSRVDIQSSTIDVLRKGWFDGLTDLDTFLLSDSTVRVLDDEVLSGLANVNTIVLRSSRLNVVRRNYFPPIAYELKVLDLSDNKLESLPENIFSNMPALHTVILSRNSFTVLHEGPWRPMLHQLSSINLEGNHLVCNRTIAWLVHHDMKGKVSGQCSEPRRLSNTPLSDLDESRLER